MAVSARFEPGLGTAPHIGREPDLHASGLAAVAQW